MCDQFRVLRATELLTAIGGTSTRTVEVKKLDTKSKCEDHPKDPKDAVFDVAKKAYEIGSKGVGVVSKLIGGGPGPGGAGVNLMSGWQATAFDGVSHKA